MLAGGCSYGVAAYLLRRRQPRLKFAAVALMGITAMQWVEGCYGWMVPCPTPAVNQLMTIGLIPLALLAQAWGPLFGSTFVLPVRNRRVPFYLLLMLGLTIVIAAARGVPADAHAGHSRGTSQLVFAAESACVCTLGLRPLGVSDWSTVSAVVATLLAERADRVMGLDLGDRELYLHRHRRQFLVLLRVVLRRVCTRLRFDGERRPLAGRDGVIVLWRVLAPQMFHLHVGLEASQMQFGLPAATIEIYQFVRRVEVGVDQRRRQGDRTRAGEKPTTAYFIAT